MDATTAEEEVDVIVVGAGVSGIASALSLSERGLKVALIESRSILGGRARSWIDGVTRDPVHIGPHVVISEYPNFFELLRQIGTLEKLVWQPGRHFLTWVRGTRDYHVRSAPLPAPACWGLVSAMDPFVTMADKHSTVPAMLHILTLSEDKILELDNESGADFLRRLGVREAYIQHFWAFVSHAILNVTIEEVSAAALARFMRILLGRSRMDMGFIDGGLGDVLTPAREILAGRGSTVLTSTEVAGFLGGDQCSGVQLDDGRQLHARLGVVSSLPPQTLLPLLPPSWVEEHESLRELKKLKPCKYLSVYLWFDRKVSEGKQFWARTYDNKDYNCEFYDFSHIYSGEDSKGTAWKDRPSFIGSNIIDAGRLGEVTDEEVVERTLKELAERYAGVREAKVLHSVVNRVPMAIHRPVAGTERLRPDQASPVRGLYLAGCWTRTGFCGSMESAARSGFLAAERLLQRNGKECKVAVPYQDIDFTARLAGKFDALRPALIAPLFQAMVWFSSGSLHSKL